MGFRLVWTIFSLYRESKVEFARFVFLLVWTIFLPSEESELEVALFVLGFLFVWTIFSLYNDSESELVKSFFSSRRFCPGLATDSFSELKKKKKN